MSFPPAHTERSIASQLTRLTNAALENAFRAAIAFLPPRPITNPAWYHKRAAFYVFLPTLEVIVVILYAVARVDQRMFEHGKAEREANTANTSDEEKSRSGTEL